MNNRKISKEDTKNRIIEAAKKEFIKNGFLNTSTVLIAKKAGVAHGTVFLHFKNKDNLILEILNIQLYYIADKLYKLLLDSSDIEDLLNNYLDFLSNEEEFFTVLKKELPFYPEKLRREIFFKEGVTRKYFFDAVKKALEKKEYTDEDLVYILDLLFGTVNYYLSMSDLFGYKNCIIKTKKKGFIETFLKLLGQTSI